MEVPNHLFVEKNGSMISSASVATIASNINHGRLHTVLIQYSVLLLISISLCLSGSFSGVPEEIREDLLNAKLW